MRVVIFLLICTIFSYASNLLTFNIYERSDRVDIMLSFDAPYEGSVSQKKGSNITTITLNDLSYNKLIEKNINSNIIQSVTIEPNNDTINVVLKSENDIAVIASKTIDGFGLRIRTKPLLIKNNTKKSNLASTATKQNTSPIIYNQNYSNDLIDNRYISVIVVLIILLLFMLWIKKRIGQKNISFKNQSSWLFKSNKGSSSNSEIKILKQKMLDTKNSVLLLQYENKQYLVMSGNSNLLLDNFSNNEVKNDNDFEKAFEDNRKKLDDYIRLQKDDSFGDYKSRVQQEYTSKLE